MKTQTKKDKVAESITLLAEAIKGLEEKIEEYCKPEVKVEMSTALDSQETVQGNQTLTSATIDNFPKEFRVIIDERLNQKFKATVDYKPNGFFEFCVYVPKEYSNASEEHWKLNHEDKRLRMIENALGEIGVREWVDKITENLGHDIMLKVQDDKFK